MTAEHNSKAEEFRLPSGTKPVHYDIVIAPHIETGTFEGSEMIELELSEPASCVKLNTKEVVIHQAHIECDDGTKLFGSVTANDATEITTISFNGTVAPGSWRLFLRFSGSVNSKLKGIYKSSWTDSTGKEGKLNSLAATQFCATDARRAFPCFDEPAMKATFRLSLIVDRNHTALSNYKTEYTKVIRNGGTFTHYHSDGLYSTFGPLYNKKVVQFKTTMKMSTYLLAFVVGDLVSTKTVTVNGTELRVWCTPGNEKLMDFALEAASFGLAWFEDYFKIKCPGDGKIDLIAVPDHAYGAMENLGCVTFREPALLVDRATASVAELKRVAGTVIHELAHMWFGDLVTMSWWNGVWLNEAFATFMQKLATHAWKPEWGIFEDFSSSRAQASDIDALKSTHPIESPVGHPDEASEMFDVISYQKGCAVLYQLHEFIGADVFRDGIIRYLNAHAYGNTETHDLWDALEKASQAAGLSTPVREIMDAWVFTPGHPVLLVEESTLAGCIKLSQSRFSFTSRDDGQLLPVPVILRLVKASGIEEFKRVVLWGDNATVYVGEDVDYVIVNANGSGFYRVIYSDALAQALLENGLVDMSQVERYNLINDSWDAVRAGIYNGSQYLNILSYFVNEHDSRVWQMISRSLARLNRIVSEEARQGFKDFVYQLVSPTVKRLGWHPVGGETLEDLETRMYVLPPMVTICGDDVTVLQARAIYEMWKESKESVAAEILSAALDVLAYAGDEELYDEFSAFAFKGETPQERDRFLYALAEFQSKDLAARTLARVKSGEVRTGDTPALISKLMSNSSGRELTWQYLRDNFDTMVRDYPEPAVIKLVRTVAALDTSELQDEVNRFFEDRVFKSGALAIAQSLEQMSTNVELKKREKPMLDSVLA